MKRAIGLAAALAVGVSAGAFAQQGGSAKTKSAGQNMTHCLKVGENKKDRMIIHNTCDVPVNVVYCWKGGAGDKSKYSCANDGHMERVEAKKRLATRGEPKAGDSRLLYLGCASPASPRFTSTSGSTPEGVCSR